MAAKRKKTSKRNPPQRRVSRIRKKQTSRVKNAKQRSNRKPKAHARKPARPSHSVRKQRRSSRARTAHKRVVKRTPIRATKGKARRVKKTRRVTPEQQLRRELSHTRDRLRRTEESLREVTRYKGGSTGGYAAPDTPVRPSEYEPSKTVRSTEFDKGDEIPTYVGEEFGDIDWDDFDWDYFDDYEDQEEDSYGDEAK